MKKYFSLLPICELPHAFSADVQKYYRLGLLKMKARKQV